MGSRSWWLCAAWVLALPFSACTTLPQVTSAPEPDDMPLAALDAPKGVAGGVVIANHMWSLTSDVRAFRAGDALTVELEELTMASKKSGTQVDKSSSISAKRPTIFGAAGLPFDAEVGVKRGFDGAGSTSQQNALRGSVTVIVQRVMPNGLLQVRGEKRLVLNQGEETVHLAGYVRAADIDANNRVSSQRVANARIRYSGKGSLADASQPGWLTRFFNSPWMPF